MKLAKIFCGALVSAAIASETDEIALLQSRKVVTHSAALPKPPGDICVAAGDPHVETFDMVSQSESCLGPMGDYVLMSNSDYFVHARFTGYQRDKGYAFVRGLVIGGSALGGTVKIPIHNTDCLSFNGTCLAKQFGLNSFDLAGGVELVVRKGAGPDLVNWNATTSQQDTSRPLSYFVEIHRDGALDLLVVVNQGANQHVMISGTQSALAGTTGLCGNDNGDPKDDHFNVDACPHKLPCVPGEFDTVNPECGKPREPPECANNTDRVDFFRGICEAYYGSQAYQTTHHVNPGDSAAEWQIFNCVTDCCGDRDSCPDLNNNGEWGDCLVQGDPHIKTFDSPVINKNAYGPLADYILMKNDFLEVQGRYGTSRTDRKAELRGVVVTGTLVGNDKIYFPPGVAEQPVIETPNGQGYDKVVWGADQTRLKKVAYTIRYEPQGVNLKFIFDKTKGTGKPTRLYTIVLTDPDGAKLGRVRVNKPHHSTQTQMACHIRLKPYYLTGTSGQCGNYNGDPADDQSGLEDIVQATKNLFPSENPQIGTPSFTKSCSQKQKDQATTCCKKLHGQVANSFIDACVVDNCCGADSPCDPRTQCTVVD